MHVPALRAAGFEVAALVGQDAERTARRAARLEIPHALVSFDEAIALPGVAAATIAVPPSAHRWLVTAAVRAGKHVICEKPFALNLTEARNMVAEASKAGVTALLGHEFRWAPERAVVGQAIAAGRIGTPRLATLVQYMPLVADPETPVPKWWFDPAMGGGWLNASGSHLVDQVRTWLGEFATLSAMLDVVSDREVRAEDSFTIRARMRSDCEVVLQQTAGAWGAPAGLTRVAGTEGTLWVENGVVWLANRAGVVELPVPPELALPVVAAKSDDPSEQFTHLELAPYTRLCEVLMRAVLGEPLRSAVPVPTFADGLAGTQVLDAIRASAVQGGARVSV